MLPEFGSKITKLPRALTWVRDLEEFEGPILSELKTLDGSLYAEKWCASESGLVRTLLVRTEQRVIAQYMAGRVTMLDLLVRYSDGLGFLVDRVDDVVHAVYVVHVPSLPVNYLPRSTAVHDFTLRPQWSRVPQHFLLNAEWDGKMLAKIERIYMNAYAFNFIMSDQSPPDLLPSYVLDFVYDGGFPIMHAFKHMRASVPKLNRAKTSGVSANSPGVFTIDAPSETAGRMTDTMTRIAGASKAYENLHAWSKLKPQKADQIAVPSAIEQLGNLAGFLGIDARKILPSLVTTAVSDINSDKVLVAGKLLASYYRQLGSLLAPDRGVEFLGVPVREDASGPVVDLEDEDDEPWDTL